MEIFWVC